MEVVLLVGLVLLVWWLVRSRSREEESRAQLRTYIHDEPELEPDGIHSNWHADFVAMTAEFDFSVDGYSENRRYDLRRSDGGRWRMRLTPDSYRAELESLRAGAEVSGFDKDRLAKLEGGNVWERVPIAVEGPLESQYQRFVHQYRG